MSNDLPDISCKTVAMQNSSHWPCSMCPIPQLRLVGVRASYTYFFKYFLDTLSSGPHHKSLFGVPPPGCSLLQNCYFFMLMSNDHCPYL